MTTTERQRESRRLLELTMDRLAIKFEHAVNLLIPVVILFDARAAGCAESCSQGRIVDELAHALDESASNGVRVSRVDENAAACVKVVGRPTPLRRDDRRTCGHGLEHHRPAALVDARQQQRDSILQTLRRTPAAAASR